MAGPRTGLLKADLSNWRAHLSVRHAIFFALSLLAAARAQGVRVDTPAQQT